MADKYRRMNVAQILDSTTVVVAGEGAAWLKEGDQLQIVAVGKEVPGIGLPLVVPKATLYVTSAAGPYAVARTESYETETSLFPSLTSTRVRRRYQMTINEKQMVGNPAASPVAVGDAVIRADGMSSFLNFLKSAQGEQGQ